MRLISGEDVREALEHILVTHLGEIADQAGEKYSILASVSSWRQTPTMDALTSAITPVGAISSPGLVEQPKRSRGNGFKASWRVSAGVFDRGADYDATQARVQRWAALIRATVLAHPSLGGLAENTLWTGEEYAVVGTRSAARTLGGCQVHFTITVPDVVGDIHTTGTTVQATHTTLSLR